MTFKIYTTYTYNLEEININSKLKIQINLP